MKRTPANRRRPLRRTAGPSRTRALITLTLVLVAVLGVSARQRTSGQVVAGTAVDATGAVLPRAQVTLTTTSNAAVQTTTTDAAGTFRFEGVVPGRYEIRVSFEGFQPTIAQVTVGSRAPSKVRIMLPLANVKQEVTVSNQAREVSTSAATNSDAVTVDKNLLESLPVFDQDVVATVSRFLDAGSLGNGGVTVVVNGMEVSALVSSFLAHSGPWRPQDSIEQ
ncbi:MAG: carboxypeptidase-like regulatory domain-containing protein [Acidobacteria bacterium]|nr:carboxypeptidase-like regulatory domain-containing protein [Acidobacteriota bacterium]